MDLDQTGWKVGMSNLEYTISLPEISIGTEIIQGTPYPADYEIRVFDHIVDTSCSYLDAPEIPMFFGVWNVTGDYQVDIVYNEIDGD